ncbi:MAG: putative HAD-hydrolase [Friedmanniella sp.]|nr:putative HAD-hydrolase [Friedmanniella sp.]
MTGLPRAVVFDFYGTLSDPGVEAAAHRHDQTSAHLGLDTEAFVQALSRRFRDRVLGVLGDSRTTLEALAHAHGARPGPDRVSQALAVHLEGAVAASAPHPAASAVLTALRDAGIARGLVSDCSSELVELWPEHPLRALVDATVFSWQERRRKPDHHMYATACERLGMRPRDCWYVGDGGSRELWGASRAGMTPVLVANVHYPRSRDYRADPRNFVPDRVVDDLSDLPHLLGLA